MTSKGPTPRGGTTGAVQLYIATDYSQQKRTTWVGRGRIIIAQSKANCLSCTAPVVPPLTNTQAETTNNHSKNIYLTLVVCVCTGYNVVLEKKNTSKSKETSVSSPGHCTLERKCLPVASSTTNFTSFNGWCPLN